MMSGDPLASIQELVDGKRAAPQVPRGPDPIVHRCVVDVHASGKLDCTMWGKATASRVQSVINAIYRAFEGKRRTMKPIEEIQK